MGKVIDRIKSVWGHLETSYDSMGKVNESRKDFLARISGVQKGIPSLSSVLVALEKEITEDESLIEEGRILYEQLSVVQDNWENINKVEDISNLDVFISKLVQEYIKSNKTEVFDDSLLSFRPRSVILLDSLEMLVGFKSITGYVEMQGNTTSSTKVFPVEMQKAIASVGYSTAYYVRSIIDGVGVTDYLKLVHNLTITHFENNSQILIFLPKNLYRRTPTGCNVVVDGRTVRFPTTDTILFEGEQIPYTDYHGILVLHTKYDYEPVH